MTREEAIKMLKSKMDGHMDTSYEWAETVRMAIKALEQEPCEDAISRADARHLIAETNRKALGCISTKAFKILYDGMDALPPVTPQPKTGHWIMTDDTNWYDAYFKCSCCGREIGMPYDLRNQVINKYPYCHCGAKMIEP